MGCRCMGCGGLLVVDLREHLRVSGGCREEYVREVGVDGCGCVVGTVGVVRVVCEGRRMCWEVVCVGAGGEEIRFGRYWDLGKAERRAAEVRMGRC